MKAKKTEKKKTVIKEMPQKEEKPPYVRFEFPVGNNFWTRRSKHGRDRLFETPQLLWEAACEYFKHCDDNPFIEVEQGKKASKPFTDDDGEVHFPPDLVELPKMKPYTLHGLVCYLDASVNYLNEFEKSLIGKNDDISRDFLVVISRIREIIYNQKFSGAASGFLNPNIIARDLGLVDKIDNAVKIDTESKIELKIDGKELNLSK